MLAICLARHKSLVKRCLTGKTPPKKKVKKSDKSG
jgi:hypothetical protein